ncbi:MAG: HD domain-containing protein [Halobacteriovoraceae bacterium]|nr:HD domain-containing protein [Halobacteriovoraceae bacterium]
MEIRDPVHGSIHVVKEAEAIIQAEFFQRLRGILQLGFTEYIFPGATHTRFLHSIGVMEIGGRAFDQLFSTHLGNSEFLRLKETFKLACMLHDVGHAPLSHSTEIVMPSLAELKIPCRFLSSKDLSSERQATHEDYTIKSIVDSSLSDSFKDIENKYGVQKEFVADIIRGKTNEPEYFTILGVNYFPILHQLVSSEMDCDRMDYLLRDSYFCGVSYGNYDLDWLLDNLEICVIDGEANLGISERAVVTFDDFLLSRYHMFVMVYFHYRPVWIEQLLYKYFASAPGEYSIPADIEKYIEHDDHYLMKILRASKNQYAEMIVKNNIPSKIYESFNNEQLVNLEKIETFLKTEDIEHIRCSSLGRLSKYYSADESPSDKYSMKVVRKLRGSDKKIYSDINQATDLFSKFSQSHHVNRLHCNTESLTPGLRAKLEDMISS